jgi:hypothetical protein
MKFSTFCWFIVIIILIMLLIYFPVPDREIQEVQRKENKRAALAENLYEIEKDGKCYAILVWEHSGGTSVGLTQIECRKKEASPGNER